MCREILTLPLKHRKVEGGVGGGVDIKNLTGNVYRRMTLNPALIIFFNFEYLHECNIYSCDISKCSSKCLVLKYTNYSLD